MWDWSQMMPKSMSFRKLLWTINILPNEEFSLSRPIKWLFLFWTGGESETSHREPKASIFVQAFQFNSRLCSLDESVADYVAALQRLAEHCAFGDMLDEMLWDLIVCSINNSAIQKQLLAKPELTLTKPVLAAQVTELADTAVKGFQSSTGRASSVFPRKIKAYTSLLMFPQQVYMQFHQNQEMLSLWYKAQSWSVSFQVREVPCL